MAARRLTRFAPAELAWSVIPIVLLSMAAIAPPLRLPLLLVLATGTGIAIVRDAPVRWAWAAALPVGVSLVWETFAAPVIPLEGSACQDPASPVAAWRALEAVCVLVTLAATAVVLRAARATLYLRWPARSVGPWAAVALVAGPIALVIGPYLARPFFGDVSYTFAVAALAPAAIFAISNGVMEELIYRDALLGWSARAMGLRPALVGQAVVFGFAHSGADVIGFQVPLILAMGLGGLFAALLTIRTRSLLVPIAVHIAFDLPIYFAFACPA
jgi:membrane protease YdiL (CAAX protease family)